MEFSKLMKLLKKNGKMICSVAELDQISTEDLVLRGTILETLVLYGVSTEHQGRPEFTLIKTESAQGLAAVTEFSQ